MNKKFILTSILTLTFALPAVAEITSGATCDTTNLGQSENNSTANVEADWSANTININWFADESALLPMQMNTCTYDGTITLPTEPTKTGYTFAGWKLREGGENNSNNNTLITCSEISNQSDCNLQATCMWSNNACLTTEEFCNTATTESDCTTTNPQMLNAHPDGMMIQNCRWILIDRNYKCTTKSVLELLD